MTDTVLVAITLLRKAIALYYPSGCQYDEGTRQFEEAMKNPIERGLYKAYRATATLDPEPEHFLGYTIDHNQNMGKAMEIVEEIRALEMRLHHVDTRSAKEKAENWAALTEHPGADYRPYPTLAVGTVVRATKHLDPGVADILPGTLGFVFGEANCYGDGAGPIVQWITYDDSSEGRARRGPGRVERGFVADKVCNVYIGDVEIVRVHDTVQVGHL